ncbi:MAG: hypothetical protein AAGC60_25080 [Acidobacteriota bacterium]
MLLNTLLISDSLSPRAPRAGGLTATVTLAIVLGLLAASAGASTPPPAAPTAAAAEVSTGSAVDDVQPAYRLQPGSIARARIVALGRDLVIDGDAMSHAVALSGDAHITGSVADDLIVLDGDAHLADTAVVGGDVYVLGGRIDAAPGASIGGRSVAYPDASTLWVALVQGPVLGAKATSATVLGTKLALLAFWTVLVLLLFSLARRELVATSEAVQSEPFRNFFVGLTGVAAMVLTALFCSAFAGAVIGVPLLVLVVVAALVLRFWGMVAVFHALGTWLHRTVGALLAKGAGANDGPFGRRGPVPLAAATWGLLALGVLKLLPYLGIWSWSIATFIGVGAALSTKLGRRERWLDG